MGKIFEISGLNIYIQIFFTVLFIIIHLFATRKKQRKESIIEIIAVYTISLSGRFTLINGVLGQMIYADQVALSIGWPINSGFQMELGFTATGIGIIGFVGFWKRLIWLPYIITRSTFLLAAGITHIIHIVREGNLSPYNKGIVLFLDFILPKILVVNYILYI